MTRLGIPAIGGPQWLGGRNYMLNLVRTLADFGPDDFEVTIFAAEAEDAELDALAALPRTRVVRDAALRPAGKNRRLAAALTAGSDPVILRLFRDAGITIGFEVGEYFGWRLPMPMIAWMPDFQHRRLPHLFSASGWLKRELGFRAQAATRNTIMLSSADSERDCQIFYPRSRGRTHTVRFAVEPNRTLTNDAALKRAAALQLPERFFFLPNQLWLHKNHVLAIRAAAHLAKDDPAVVVASGHGIDARVPNLRAELTEIIAREGLQERFRLLDGLPYHDVQALTLACSAIVNPSRFEGWSTTVEEAKAVGTPLILSDLPVHREQSPTARFFGVDDPQGLADALAATPTRTADLICEGRRPAAEQNLKDREAFAAAFVATAHAAERA